MATVKVDLTDGKEITPELVADVRMAMDLERRQRPRRTHPGRRSMDFRPGEVERISREQRDKEES
jgi:hypothetical protein